MQASLAAITIVVLILLVLIRSAVMRREGIRALNFGKIDRKDFLIPPFALFYLYMIAANAFGLPTVSRFVFFRSEVASWVGVLLCIVGVLLFSWSLISFGRSFRVGIDLAHSGRLVTGGAFRFSRNPIYVAFGFVVLGQFLVFSSFILLAYLVAAAWLFHRQVLREEEFLRNHFGDEYAQYCSRTRRYV